MTMKEAIDNGVGEIFYNTPMPASDLGRLRDVLTRIARLAAAEAALHGWENSSDFESGTDVINAAVAAVLGES